MSVRDELLKFKNSSQKSNKQRLQEQSVFSNLPGVQPDKMDYRRPIPDPEILPDCFTALLKSNINMVSFDKNSLKDETQKRINNVDVIYNPKSPSSDLGLTIMKDGKPFCFVKK
jgi:hypothetical protein